MNYKFPNILPAFCVLCLLKIKAVLSKLRSSFLCYIWGIDADGHVYFGGKTLIRSWKRGDIKVGKNCIFRSDIRENLVGLMNPTILNTTRGGKIVIGDNSGFSSVVISSKSQVEIGNRVLVGGNVRIFDHDFHSLNFSERGTALDSLNDISKPVKIGDDVFIGTNCLILKGARIGDRSVIAAGSVVFGMEIPSDSLVKGNPAIVVKRLNNAR